MRYLLGVNALLAAIVKGHPNHAVADKWIQNKALAVCPLSELGFLRVSTHPKAYNFAMAIARQALRDFIRANQVEFFAADLPALRTIPAKSDAVADSYLAELAGQHNLKLATLDAGIKHAAAELMS